MFILGRLTRLPTVCITKCFNRVPLTIILRRAKEHVSKLYPWSLQFPTAHIWLFARMPFCERRVLCIKGVLWDRCFFLLCCTQTVSSHGGRHSSLADLVPGRWNRLQTSAIIRPVVAWTSLRCFKGLFVTKTKQVVSLEILSSQLRTNYSVPILLGLST